MKKGNYAPKSSEVMGSVLEGKKKVFHNLILESHFSTAAHQRQFPQAGEERILWLPVLAHLELDALEGKIPGH